MARTRAFTLIELLIVVAIIAILAAIAMPYFLNAQMRARIARSQSELRTLDLALQSYMVENIYAPRGNYFQLSTSFTANSFHDKGLVLLSTPIAYLVQALIEDPFPTALRCGALVQALPIPDTGSVNNQANVWYKYAARSALGTVGTSGNPDNDTRHHGTEWYVLQSTGPDNTRFTLGNVGGIDPQVPQNFLSTIYDPTNGIVSRGSLYRAGGSPSGPGWLAFRLIAEAHQ